MKDSRNKYYYDTIKTALLTLKAEDYKLQILDDIDETQVPFLCVDIEEERYNYTLSEDNEYITDTETNFTIYYMYKLPKKNSSLEEIRAHTYYWIDLIESKFKDLTITDFTDSLNNETARIDSIWFNGNNKIYPNNKDVNGVQITGLIKTIIINNL